MSSPSIPPPPGNDAPPSRRAGAVATFLLLVGVLVLAIGLLALPAPPSRPAVAPPDTPATSPFPADDPGYAFIATRPFGQPVVWEKCVLRYRLLVNGAPSYALADVEEALRRLSAATGFRFEHVSDAADDPVDAIPTIISRRSTGEADIVIAWASHDQFVETSRQVGSLDDAVAWTRSLWLPEGIATHFDGALILMDRDLTQPEGFDAAYSHGVVLMHELGHAVGLAHVRDPTQVMESGARQDLSVNDYGEGDLAGLAAVGAPASCAAA